VGNDGCHGEVRGRHIRTGNTVHNDRGTVAVDKVSALLYLVGTYELLMLVNESSLKASWLVCKCTQLQCV
jgi:hypothetical protein